MDARGFDHDVMLYAFLLDADPGGCPLEEQARRKLDLKLGHSPEQHADITLEFWNHLSPAVEARGLRDLYSSIELPLTRVLARMERDRRSHRFHRAVASLAIDGGRDCAAHFRDPRACRQAVQHRIAATVGQGACSKI